MTPVTAELLRSPCNRNPLSRGAPVRKNLAEISGSGQQCCRRCCREEDLRGDLRTVHITLPSSMPQDMPADHGRFRLCKMNSACPAKSNDRMEGIRGQDIPLITLSARSSWIVSLRSRWRIPVSHTYLCRSCDSPDPFWSVRFPFGSLLRKLRGRTNQKGSV